MYFDKLDGLDVRLVPDEGEAPSNTGRLEILHDGQWGTVCDYLFEDIDATVACRSLGFL